MLKNFFHIRVELWMTVLIFAIIAGITIAAFFYFREVVYNYNLLVPGGGGVELPLQYGTWPALTNLNFFEKVRNQFIDDKVTFVEADLSKMILRVYQEGKPAREVPIITKGKEDSWWETPAGLYRVESKEKNHFSSFGRVYQPWSIQFQGNFFIHGWPYYSDGTPVGSQYSGGCIRLNTPDAEAVFEMVKIGTPVLVYEEGFSNADNFTYERRLPEISAQNFLVADLFNNFVFVKRNATDVVPIASITKLLTALVTVEYINLENEILIDDSMLVKTSKPRLRAGQYLSAFQLLYPLLLESSNEAAVALSHYLGPVRFVDLINRKAQSIGMEDTNLRDPSGVDVENRSTAEDLFSLAKYLYNNRGFLLKISAGKLNYSAYGAPVFSNLKNMNGFDNNPDFLGGKIGKSEEAGETLLAILNLPFSGTKRPVVIILLGSKDVFKDAAVIMDYIKVNY